MEKGNDFTLSRKSEFVRADMPRRQLAIDEDGHIHVPEDMREAMLATKAGPVLAEIVDGQLHVSTPKAAIRKVRRMIAESDWGCESVVDQLLAERRAEALREDAEALLSPDD